MQNHEIRFKAELELKQTSDKLWKEVGSQYYRTAFERNVYILGLNSVSEQIKLKNKTLLEIFSKNDKQKRKENN